VLVALLPNLLSSRALFRAFAVVGFAVALASGARGLARRTARPFQALAPIVATGVLVVGSLVVANTEDWRKAIFALMLFSVVVGLPEGLMGFASQALTRLLEIPPPPLPAPAPLDDVLPRRATDGASLLAVRGLRRHFGGVKAVDGVDLSVSAGTIHGLIGPNGSGKSTLVNVLSGLYAPTEGTMELRGAPMPRGSLMAAARAGVARTFQNLQLFGGMTALDNVMVALRGASRLPLPLVLVGLGHREERAAQARALALLELVGLADQARTPVKDLTYGAQRFLEIARALGRDPVLLVLDEPAAGLAVPDVAKQKEIIRRVHERGVTIVLIEHHMDVVTELCDVVTVLDGGRVIAEGRPDAVKRHPAVIAAYLGSVEAEGSTASALAPAPGS
jgi:branched-chain amino acid transport system permease protein